MAGRIPVGSAIFMTAAITALGYGVMYITTPTDKQFYDSLSPDLKKKVDDHRAQQAKMLEKQNQIRKISDSADSDQPVWADSLKKK